LSAQSIAQAAFAILADAQLAAQLDHAGWKRVHSTFLEKHFARPFRKAMDGVMADNASARPLAPTST